MAREISIKQRLFIEALLGQAAGNATEAARLAGYKGNDGALAQRGSENLRKGKIKAAIKALIDRDPLVLTRFDRQRLWTRISLGSELERGEEPKMSDRLKASELLGKTQLDFVTQIESTTKISGSVETTLDYSHLSSEKQIQLFRLLQEAQDADTDNDGES